MLKTEQHIISNNKWRYQTCKTKTAEENNPGVEHTSDKTTTYLANPEQECKFPNSNSQTSAWKLNYLLSTQIQ